MSALDKRIFNYIKLVYPYWNVHLCDLLLLSIVDTKRTRFVVYIYSSDGTLNIDSSWSLRLAMYQLDVALFGLGPYT